MNSSIVSNNFIEENLPSIFGDSILLNTRFEIVSICESILKVLNYEKEDLEGEDVSLLIGAEHLQQLQRDLGSGFFPEREYEVFTRNNHGMVMGISGFYLGLLSDLNGYIVLRVKNLDEVKRVQEQLEQKSLELDNFLYRTSHDLRGPLATIKGLANVAKMQGKQPDDLYYYEEILRFAEKLDNSLKNLLHIADFGTNEFDYLGRLNLDKIETVLRSIVENYGMGKTLHFDFKVKKLKYDFHINETYILSLLKNLLIYILELPKKSAKQHVDIELTTIHNNLEILITETGFFVAPEFAEKLSRKYLSCIDVLQDSNLVRFYAAKKITSKLKGLLQLQFNSSLEHKIKISFPAF